MTEQIVPPRPEQGVPEQPGEIVPPPLPLTPPPTATPPPATPRPARPALRALARWTAAVLAFAALGAGTAFGVSGPERGDVPGLSTRSDGRWAYPKLTLPALPAGSPRPFTTGNAGEIHYADLRELLLPAPQGAVVDKKLAGGWVSSEQYLSEYNKGHRSALRTSLRDYGVRHIAARGWTMPDGTVSRVYLLQFRSVAFADAYQQERTERGEVTRTPLNESPADTLDEHWTGNSDVPETTTYVFEETKPYGENDIQVRQAYIVAGDTVALVFHQKKGGAPSAPFYQTVILQNQLLG
ncbi:hypothetical protein [Streptomyces liangshanensis]|uniref:Uncharacterized protein n=1 Tax=Streptomyces liangshanensis TaxID=2717324 RepID=A0A6G9H1H9_9ACTN|nr:hypothetical protein [Streptomyces liangshanensis]QIQ04071.1 hypothetical protein HA039_18705 [Streptomyces liangshanensis]